MFVTSPPLSPEARTSTAVEECARSGPLSVLLCLRTFAIYPRLPASAAIAVIRNNSL